ncbi:hypothetical protein JXQ31_11195 [candidate division KSB1 bacterium]|nr:hypothetical protein [candidate division KSB1 bacterium]
MKNWVLIVLLFSVTVNLAVVGTLVYFWKKTDQKADNLIWISEDSKSVDGKKFIFVKKDSFVATENMDKINAKRLDWGNKMSVLNRSIDKDRKDIIRYLLVDPPQRDSINVVIHRLGDKQIKAESLTVDHLIGIRELLPPQEWEDLVTSVGNGCQIIVQKKVIKNGQNQNITVEIKELNKDTDMRNFDKK